MGIDDLVRVILFLMSVFATVGLLALCFVFPVRKLGNRRRLETYPLLEDLKLKGWSAPERNENRVAWSRDGIKAFFFIVDPQRKSSPPSATLRFVFRYKIFPLQRPPLRLGHPALTDLLPGISASAWRSLEDLEDRGALVFTASGKSLSMKFQGETLAPSDFLDFSRTALDFAQNHLLEALS